MFQKLFEEGKIGKLTLKNRVVMPAMATSFAAANGEASDEIIRYYEERAKGGCGLIITEITRIDDETGVGMSNQLAVTKLYQMKRLSRLADAIHQYDAKIFVQLHHPGRQTPSRLLNGFPVVAPSPIPCGVVKEMPKELTLEEIKDLVKKFIKGAYIAKTAGIDGVEIHAAHGYLISQFLSPYTNKRTDEYGGDFEGRTRFLSEIILGIRHVCGPDYPLIVRMNANDFLEGGLTVPDQIKLAQYLEGLGVDALNISSGMYESGWSIIEPSALPEAWKKDLALAIKSHVKIPVIAVNNIKHPEVAEKLLEAGVCDFVGIGRCHLADPQYVNKAKAGDTEAIRKCIGCLYCFKILNMDKPLVCTVNPLLGRELIYNENTLQKTGDGQKVAVIGGGPAGMQAAITLAKRGFKPVIFDKADELGGMMNLGDQPPHKALMTEFCQTMKREVVDLNIELQLGKEVLPADLSSAEFYGAVIAIGGTPLVPPIKGKEAANVYLYDQVLSHEVDLKDKKIVVVGGGETGLETAEFLADQGNQVTVVEMLSAVGQELYASALGLMLKRFGEKGVKVLTDYMVLEMKEHEAVLRSMKTSGSAGSDSVSDSGSAADADSEKVIEADAMVIASGVKIDPELISGFKEALDHVIVVGDAAGPGNIAKALKEANDKCWVF